MRQRGQHVSASRRRASGHGRGRGDPHAPASLRRARPQSSPARRDAPAARRGPPRSNDASAATIAAAAAARSSRTPARAGTTWNASPRRRTPASTAGRSTARGDPSDRDSNGRRVARTSPASTSTPNSRRWRRRTPRTGAKPSAARGGLRHGAGPVRANPELRRREPERPSAATNVTGSRSTRSARAARSAVAAAPLRGRRRRPPRRSCPASRLGEPASSATPTIASSHEQRRPRWRLDAPRIRGAARRRVVRGTLVAPEDTGSEM